MTIAKRMPEQALTPKRDPLLDDSPLQKVWKATRDWALGIVGVFAFLAIASGLARLDAAVTIQAKERDNSNLRREIAQLQHQLSLREASGNCMTLFWLVEAGTPERTAEKLFQVSMRLATTVGEFTAAKEASR
jgi:hypothetical protein